MHREILMRLYGFWKVQQQAIMNGTNAHDEFKFGYNTTLDNLMWIMDENGQDAKGFSNSSNVFSRRVVDITLDRCSRMDNEIRQKGAKRAVSDFLILIGVVPPVAITQEFVV
jgi:hypothetical protein